MPGCCMRLGAQSPPGGPAQVVPYPAIWQEGCLRGVHDIAEQRAHSAGYGTGCGLEVGGFFWGGGGGGGLQDKVRAGGSEQGRTPPSNTRTRIGQTLGVVSGHPGTLRMRRLAEAHLTAGWHSGLTCS